jgi:hypothetical protein
VKKGFWCRLGSDAATWLIMLSTGIFGSCAVTTESKLPDVTQLSPKVIRDKVTANYQRLQSFSGKAQVSIELPGTGYNGYSSVYINFPDSIFVKTEAMLGIDIGALFCDYRYFAAYAPRDNILYYGEIELLDLRAFLDIEMDTEELYEAFTGLPQITQNGSSDISRDGGYLLIKTVVDRDTLKQWVDPGKYVVTRSELLNPSGDLIFVKEFRSFKKRKNIYLPQIIKMMRPLARERITVVYTNQSINKNIARKRFKINISDNAKRIYWGDIKQPAVDRDPSNAGKDK